MKHIRPLAFGLFLLFAFLSTPAANAQDPTTQTQDSSLGTALLNEYTLEYDVVFKAIKTALEGIGYEVNYASKKNSRIETSFKQLATADDFFDVMKKYGDIPYIRSPGWTIGRSQVKITLEKMDSSRTAVRVIAQLSGFEERFENRWVYWKSNGRLEEDALAAINAAVEAVKQ